MRPDAPFPFRLAAIDVDDTLTGPGKKISAANLSAVERLRSRGCRVVLASGRRHANLTGFCTALGLDDFAVSCQGARVQHVRTGEVIHLALVDPAPAGRLIATGAALGFSVIFWGADGIRSTTSSPWVERYLSQTGNEPVHLAAAGTLQGQAAEKIVWTGEPAALIRAAARIEEARLDGVATTEAHDWCLEFAAPGATKAAGVAAIARQAGIPRAAVLAFGDGYNDVSLLRWAGWGVAMAHGRQEARAAAHQVSPEGAPDSSLARAVDELFRRRGRQNP